MGLMIKKSMGEASRGLVMVYFLLWVMVTWLVILWSFIKLCHYGMCTFLYMCYISIKNSKLAQCLI